MPHLHQRFLVAVPVEQDALRESRRLIGHAFGFEKLGQQEGLTAQPHRARIVWKQIAELVPEDRRAAWLEHDHRYARIDRLAELLQDRAQIRLRAIEQAEVVQRTTATERASRNRHGKTGGLEDLERRPAGFGMKGVVERVDPQDHVRGPSDRRLLQPCGCPAEPPTDGT